MPETTTNKINILKIRQKNTCQKLENINKYIKENYFDILNATE